MILAIFFASLNLNLAQAQTPTPTPDSDGCTACHDDPKNDPTPKGEALKLKKIITQKSLLFFPIGTPMADAIDESYNEARLIYRFSKKRRAYLSNPEALNLYKIHAHRYVPQAEFGSTIINTDEEYEGISTGEWGYCWGLASMNRYFTIMAFFDPSLPKDSDFRDTRKKITDVLSGKATVIPGYKNFREFSLNPEVELTIKVAVMELWRNRAERGSSLKVFRHSADWQTKEQATAMLADIEARIGRHEQPKIAISAIIPTNKVLGISADIHLLLGYRVDRLADGRARIYVWDVDFYTDSMKKDEKFIEMDQYGGFHYQPWAETKKPYAAGSDLVRVILSPDNDIENAQMLRSLKKFCATPLNEKYCAEHSEY